MRQRGMREGDGERGRGRRKHRGERGEYERYIVPMNQLLRPQRLETRMFVRSRMKCRSIEHTSKLTDFTESQATTQIY